MTNELAKDLAKNIRDKEDMKQSLTKGSSAPDYVMFPQETITVKNIDVEITLDYPNDDAFILNLPAQAILGTTELGAGSSGTAVDTLWMKREWRWNNYDDLNNGTHSPNITIDNGDIQLGR